MHELDVSDHAVDLAAAQLHHRQAVQLLQLFLHPHDYAFLDLDLLLVLQQQAVLVFAVERLLYVFLGVVELPAVEVQDGAGHVEQLIDW